MTKTNEELYKLAMDFVVNSKHGTIEETEVLIKEVKQLGQEETVFFMGVISGFISSIMDFSVVGKLTEPILQEFFNQRYLTYKKDKAFETH